MVAVSALNGITHWLQGVPLLHAQTGSSTQVTSGPFAMSAQTAIPVEIDRTTGFRATPFCPEDSREIRYYAPGTAPKEFCPVHSPFRPGGGP